MSSQFNFGTPSSSLSVPSMNTMTTNAFGLGSNQSQASVPTIPSLSTTTPFTFNTSQTPMTSAMTLTLTTNTGQVNQTSAQPTNAFHGLGGIQTVATDEGFDQNSNANKSSKELTYIPPEMMPLVDAFKQFVKEQKQIREENSQQRFSIQPILEVGNELEDNLKQNLHKIEVDIQRNAKAIEALKRDTNKLLSNAEMAYRISRVDLPQTPSSYTIAQNKYINASSHQYFMEMINGFETQMNNYSKQIKELQTHIDNMNKPYTSEELFQIMRKQHETLISLAAKVYAIHEKVNDIKHKQQTNADLTSKLVNTKPESTGDSEGSKRQTFTGPNPFTLTGDENIGNAVNQTPQQNITTNIGWPANQSIFSSNASLVQPIITSGSSFQLSPNTSSITSHSRAKRYTTS